jgi:hypothetical protein
MTTKPTSIAELEATIDRLQQRWKPYARIQPLSINAFPNPLQYDPTRLIAKQELALEIDAAQAELARLKAQQARETLAGMADALARAEATEREALAARVAAEQALQEANATWANANDDLDRLRERQQIHEQIAASQERAVKRWSDERVRDQTILEDAEAVQKRQQVFRANRDRERAA